MKTILNSLVLFFVVLSLRAYAQTVIENGKFEVNTSTQGYTLDKGQDERIVTIEIKFTKTFSTKPDIILNINKVDASKDANLRYDVEPSFVSTDGFFLKIRTWADSKIYALSGSWTAIGQ